ncbi:ATP-binding cassette domain-containing protein [Anaerocolumna xylanovorans]|uniref:Putative ABC transport system ATP-binding protein n=1 Tax=Anaerocolumna xylanovorans DSM 12503 TaxID=1121345 RepID=A0A1M7Y744_9FIRM|nr:ATP-binding cassette domain-containing protein [Anaerocolumna xylanovorans]SHO48338.1 putative ABC transport system ATP-binding protein [Anaerocolumna xylanovorans DSM 12503]
MNSEIIISNLCFKIKNKIIFHDLNIKLNNGIYVLQGKSGIGKTTLLNLISGLYGDYKGNIIIAGCNKLSYMFQDEMLFSNLTVKENLFIKYCAQNTDKSVFTTILEKLLYKYDLGDLTDEKIKYLSGGERQRLQLAVLSIDEPDIILLDEPFSKLDYETRNKTFNYILKEWSDKMVIIVSHDTISTDYNIKYLHMEEGKLHEL